jgi:hypothetical protein
MPEGATAGGAIGGTIGLLAGIGALAIPGLGPFIAAGPIIAALSGGGDSIKNVCTAMERLVLTGSAQKICAKSQPSIPSHPACSAGTLERLLSPPHQGLPRWIVALLAFLRWSVAASVRL